MNRDKHGMPGSVSVSHRRGLSRFSKYALIAFFALLTFGLWRQSATHAAQPDVTNSTSETKSGQHETSFLTPDEDTHLDPSSSEPSSQAIAQAPSTTSKSSFPRFGKITATFGEPDPPYENAIASHKLHNEIHGYPHFILREQMLRGLWSKHAYIMSIIGNELAKPESERLKWVLWHDRDTVLMNPQIPLDIFVPPSPAFDHIHMLVTNDRNGLNNGVFLARVSAANLKFFASALSIREYQPEIQLKYTEQSGMEEVIKRVSCLCLTILKFPSC
jgi:hypothetical protein